MKGKGLGPRKSKTLRPRPSRGLREMLQTTGRERVRFGVIEPRKTDPDINLRRLKGQGYPDSGETKRSRDKRN